MCDVISTLRLSALLILVAAALAACDDDGHGHRAAASGAAQKGPLQPGGSARAQALASDGSVGGETVIGSIEQNGAFNVPKIGWTGPARLTMSGAFFNEYTGNFSMGNSDRVTLYGLAALPADGPANVNLYTHFVTARVQKLMAAGTAFADARDQARSEFGNVVGIDAAPSTLDLRHDDGDDEHVDDSANLLLFSAAVLAAGVEQAGLDAIAADLADNGVIDGDGQSAFERIGDTAADQPDLLATVRRHMQNQYGVAPPNDTDGQPPAWVAAADNTPAAPEAAFTTSGALKVDATQSFDAGGSAGDELSYAWDFGDSENAAGATPTHVYAEAGDYLVMLTVTDSADQTDTVTRDLTITGADETPAPPSAEFAVVGNRRPGQSLAFDGRGSTGAARSYAWNFGDGGTATGAQPNHSYPSAGSYTVTLTVTDSAEQSDQTNKTLKIEAAPPSVPEAAFTTSGPLTAGQSQSFDAGQSTGDDLAYSWNFGDDDTANGAETTHSFDSAGSYTVTLEVTDNAGQSDSRDRTLVIEAAPAASPKAVEANVGPATAGQAVSFDGTSSSGNDITYYWTFGDGDAATNAQVAHVYDSAGDYSVKLTVTDGDGNTDSARQSVTVGAGPQPVATDGAIDGTVTDTGGDPLQGVQVRLVRAQDLVGGARDATTDGDGKVSLNTMPTGVAFVLKLTKDGYGERFVRTTIPAGASDSAAFSATLIEREPTQTLTNAENGGSVTGSDGTAIELPANALVDESGNPVSGDVEVALTPVDVSDTNERDAFPGSFAAADESGQDGLLLSFGVAEYEITQNGDELQLAAGKQATLTVPIYIDQYQDGSAVTVGDTIPLWSLDETTGQWIQEGTGTVVASNDSPTGLAFEITAGHLSWYNCDAFGGTPYRIIPHCKVDGSSGESVLNTSETCFITGRVVGDGPYSASTTTISGNNDRALPVPSGMEYQLNAIARNGTLTGHTTVNGASDTREPVDIVLTPVTGGTGETITLPHDDAGAIDLAGEVDRYTFDASAEDVVAIEVGQNGSSVLGRAELLSADGSVLNTAEFTDRYGNRDDALLHAKLADDGRYTIRITGTDGTGGYRLSARAVKRISIDQNLEASLPPKSARSFVFSGSAETVIGVANVGQHAFQINDTLGYRVVDLSSNDPVGRSSASDSPLIEKLPADADYLLIIRNTLDDALVYKTAVARIEPPQPLDFDSAQRAQVDGELSVYGDRQFYRFQGTPGDGFFSRLDGRGDAPLGSSGARVDLYEPDGRPFYEYFFEYDELNDDFNNNDDLPEGPSYLYTSSGTLPGSGGQQGYLIAVASQSNYADENHGPQLGGYSLRVDAVASKDTIVVDDDLVECPEADAHSVHAATHAVTDGGVVEVCSGRYAEHLPFRRDSGQVSIAGRDRDNVLLANEDPDLAVVYLGRDGGGIRLETLTVVAGDGFNSASPVGVQSVTVRAAPGAEEAAGRIRVTRDGTVLDDLNMDADERSLFIDADDVIVRNSTITGAPGRIEVFGNNLLFKSNTWQITDTRGAAFQSRDASGLQFLDNSISASRSDGFNPGSTSDLIVVDDAGDSDNGTVIRGNEIDTGVGGLRLDAIGADAEFTVEQNRITSTAPAGGQLLDARLGNTSARQAADLTVRNNVFDGMSARSGNSGFIITKPEEFSTVEIINNSFRAKVNDEFTSDNDGLMALTTSNDSPPSSFPVRLRNNIFQGVDDPDKDDIAIRITSGVSIDADYDLFFGFDTIYAGGHTSARVSTSDGGVTLVGGNDITGMDPLFINDLLEVESTSPAVNAGQETMAGGPPIPDTDYDGTKRPQGANYDIGAHEQ